MPAGGSLLEPEKPARVAAEGANPMEVFLRLKDLHAYGKICESVHKTASANTICKRKRSFAKV